METAARQTSDTKANAKQALYAFAESVPVYVGKAVNAVFKAMLGGSRSERVIRDLMPAVQEINEIGERLEQDLRDDIKRRPLTELLAHVPETLELELTAELLRQSPEEVRDRRCGEIEKKLIKDAGETKTIALIPGLTLDIQAAWRLALDESLRSRLCEDMRRRLAAELVIALSDDLRKSLLDDARAKFAADIADDVAAAVISRLEKALRGPVSELFFRPLTVRFKERLAKGETLDDLLPEAFATGRLASQLVIKTPGDNPKPMRHFDVQLIGAIVLHQGKISEMVTGEGKTLVATLPAYLNALAGKGVHVVTTNDFLARRDAAWMGPLYQFLGLSVGNIRRDTSWQEKKQAYDSDITYGTNDEFGFDYLRDNMATSTAMQVQRELNYAIVDEVDNILIDEARTPLIISGMPEESTDKYYKANAVAQRLRPGIDYVVAEKEHTVTLTEEGIVHAQQALGVDSFYTGDNVDWPHHMNQALAAKELYKRDRNYVVKNGEVLIVDEFTGRLMPGRRWSEGLHQAVAAKERLHIKQETQTLATITYQNFFRMYKKLAGMTGTALTEAEEFDSIYHLDVVPIPTNMPLRRVSFPDVIYATQQEKYDAIIEEIVRVHEVGRPVLIGTIAIETSELLSRMLERRGIKHEVLNAKQHEREAYIIARAGQPGAVTIATNMAGRGTDIVLGDGVVKCRRCIIRSNGEADQADKPADDCRRVGDDPNKTVSGIENLTCGLHIVGTERHEARRIDNQLRGRSGRQGDPGTSRFFLSLEDDLMRIFMGQWVRGFMARAGFGEGQQIESAMVSRAIERAQRKVEQHYFEMRKSVLEYDEVMDEQRKVVYGMRQSVLDALVAVEIRQAIETLAARYIDERLRGGSDLSLATHRGFEPLEKALEAYGIRISEEEWLAADEAAFARLVRERVDQRKAKPSAAYFRTWIEGSIGPLADESLYPAAWQVPVIAEWAGRHGMDAPGQKFFEDAERTIARFITDKARDAARGAGLHDYLRTWAAAALAIDLPILASADAWDYTHLKQWADRIGIAVPVAEWDPISRKRDRQEALVVDKLLAACAGMTAEAAAEKLAPAVIQLYVGSRLFASNPNAARLAPWARRRFGADIEPTVMQGVFSGLRSGIVDRFTEALKARHDADARSAAGDLALIEIQTFFAGDFAAPDRNLAGLAAAFEERYGVRLAPFEMAKMSYPDLVAFLVGRVPPEVKYEIDAETVEEMVMDMVRKALDRAIEQFIDAKADPDALFAAVREWLDSHGCTIGRDEWDNLALPEIEQALAMRARTGRGQSRDEVIEQFVPAAVAIFLDSPQFAGEGGYASLAAWAGRQFSFGIRDTIEADVRKLADARKAELRARLIEAKTQAYRTQGEEPEAVVQAAREMLAEALELYLDISSGSEEFDELRVADWASSALRISISRPELENRIEAGDQAIKDLILETYAKNSGKRSVERVATEIVDAVLGLCTSAGFIESWDYTSLGTWISRAKLPVDCDLDQFQEATRAAIVDYFVKLAREGYQDRATEEVIPRVIGNALEIFVSSELSAGGRNYNALAATLNKKFNLGVSAFRLAKLGRTRLETWLHSTVETAFHQRKRQLGKYNFLRSMSALLLHTLDTRWKDHLYAMDHLKAGIGLRGYAGVDPKDAYKKEGYETFTKMLASVEDSVSDLALKVYFDDEESKRVTRRRDAEEQYVHEQAGTFDRGREQAAASAGKADEKPKPIRAQKMPGRNDPCPCGKKKPDGTPVKYKNCCMNKGAA